LECWRHGNVQVDKRSYQETLGCSRLNDSGKRFVSFIGVYSTWEHPFALVFAFMDHLNLREYLRDHRDVGRLELLLAIARGLRYMHVMSTFGSQVPATTVPAEDLSDPIDAQRWGSSTPTLRWPATCMRLPSWLGRFSLGNLRSPMGALSRVFIRLNFLMACGR